MWSAGPTPSLLKEGLYKFNADEGQVEVIDGKASVNDNGQNKEIGKGKELVLTGAALKPVSFDRRTEDDLYRWSDVRASYLAQANEASARTVYVDGGWGHGLGSGMVLESLLWRRMPGLPGDGFFWSPFGYPFFSPGYVRYAPAIRSFYPAGGRATIAAGRGTIGARARRGVVERIPFDGGRSALLGRSPRRRTAIEPFANPKTRGGASASICRSAP